MRRVDVHAARRVLWDTTDALKWVHDAGFLHNDIKPSNILYNPSQGAVLIDFGLGGRTIDPVHSGGSPWYPPPECLIAKTRGTPADVFALGVTMVWVLRKCALPDVGEMWLIANLHHAAGPASAQKQFHTQTAMMKWLFQVADLRDGLVQHDLEQVVQNMLTAEPDERWSAERVLREVAL